MKNVSLVCHYIKYKALHPYLSGAVLSCSSHFATTDKILLPFPVAVLVLRVIKMKVKMGLQHLVCIWCHRGMELETLSISWLLQERPTRCFVEEVLPEHGCNLIRARFPPCSCWQFFSVHLACYLF